MTNKADRTGAVPSWRQDPWGRARRLLPALYRILVVEYVLGLGIWAALADGLKDLSGTPLGADFINVYAAGLMVWQGRAPLAYDWVVHRQVEQAVTGYDSPYFGWHYPPLFLALAAGVALLPYLAAFAVYMGAGLWAYAAVLRRVAGDLRDKAWLLAAFPGVMINIGNGQNGFITTALFGAGLWILERRPVLAGVCFGALVYKPQFFVAIPFVLFVGGFRRAAVVSVAVAAALSAAAWGVFGTATMLAFGDSLSLTRHIVLEQGSTGWEKIQSVFSMVRLWGGSVSLAYEIQAVVGGAAVLAAAWVWAKRASLSVRIAALTSAALLATPYVMDYDLTVLIVPVMAGLSAAQAAGYARYEKGLLAVLWMLPLLARILGGWGLPVTPPVLVAFLALAVAQARQQRA